MLFKIVVIVLFTALQPLCLSAQTQMQQLNAMLTQMSTDGSFDTDKFDKIAASAPAQQQFLIYAKLRTYYCERYLTADSMPISDIENIINSYFTFDNRLGYFTFCTERQLFNVYTASEFEYFSKNADDKSEYDNLHYALDLYNGLYRYKHNCAKNNAKVSKEDYSYSAELLDKALSYKPNDTLNDILDDCLHKSGNFERLFWITAYRHYDRENDNILKTAQLYLLYRKIKHPSNSFAQLCQNIKTEVLSDTVNRFTVSKDPTSEVDLTVIDIKGQTVPLINSAPQKNKSSTIVLFFSVTCHNCIDEMNTLSKMADDLRQRNIGIVGVYTMFNNPQTAADELKSFQTTYNYLFPTYLDPNRSSISSRYGITSVPSMVLMGSDGTVRGIGSFSHYGHLADKFRALLRLFD